MSMKTLLAPLFLAAPMLTACVLPTDFDDDSTGDDGIESTDSEGSEDSDTGSPCGNGMLDPGEACDDANGVNGDGCQADCTITGGETLWTVEAPEHLGANSAAALPNGGFAVGMSQGGNGGVLHYDASGQLVWAQTAAFEGIVVKGLAASLDGDVLVVGTTVIDPDFAIGELWVGELSAADGSPQWTASPAIAGSRWGNAIASNPDGTLWVAGSFGGEGGSGGFMARLAADGTVQWSDQANELGVGSLTEATDVVALPDGSAVFVGVVEVINGQQPLWARRIDPSGTTLWTTSFAFPPHVGFDASIERRPDGTLVVVSTGEDADEQHTVVIELDEGGTELQRSSWQRDVTDGQRIHGTALAGDGTLYLAGRSVSLDGALYGALDEQGEHLWSQVSSPGAPLDGSAYDVAVLSDGGVVFVGWVRDGSDWNLWMRKTGA